MIVKASQRAGGSQLAAHLLNARDNESVVVAELRGLLAEDLPEAFAEMEAQARGTRCRKPFYHLAISPDQMQGHWSRARYEEFLTRVEQAFGLEDHARALVYHVKKGRGEHYRDEGREHAHCVWSRIDTETGKAAQIYNDHARLMRLARDFAREHGLDLPAGFEKDEQEQEKTASKAKTLAEQKQQERSGETKEERAEIITAIWQKHTEARAFVQALARAGYTLARGDGQKRRAGKGSQPVYVVIDRAGEAHSLARQIAGVKTKEIANRLQDGYALDTLDDVAATRATLKRERQQNIKAPETVDREAQEAEWQKAIIDAAIKAEQLSPKFKKVVRPPDPQERATRRVAFIAKQQAELTALSTSEQGMLDRHASALGEMIERHAGALPQVFEARETVLETEQAVTGGLSFLLSFFTSVADSLARSITTGSGSQKKGQQQDKPKRQSKREKEREAQRQQQQEQQRDQQRESEALMAEQAREREAFDSRRRAVFDRQAREREGFEKMDSAPTLAHDFNTMMTAELSRQIEREQEQKQDKQRGGPELGPR